MNWLNEFEDSLELSLPADDLQAQQITDTREWHRRRLGKITASQVHKLMTSGRKKDELWGLTSKREIYRLAYERMLTPEGQDRYIDELLSKDFKQTRWGKDNEPFARDLYVVRMGTLVTVPQSAKHPRLEYFTGSPDGLVGEDGIIEIKCPWAGENMLDSDYVQTHMVQIQALLEIHGRAWCDFVKYDPRMTEPIRIERVLRDESIIADILARVVAAELEIERITNEI